MKVLILGGGGTLGAFSAGALRALHAAGWDAGAFIGSSAGSINLLRLLAAGPDAAAEFWTSLEWPRLVREALAHDFLRQGILAPASFHARVEAGVDFEAMLADPRPIGFIVVDLATGRVSVRGNQTERSAHDLRGVSRGSYALPPLLPPEPVAGRLLADGGLLQNAPLEAAIQLGASEIVYLCNVQVLPPQRWTRRGSALAALRYADIFFRRASNVGFADAHITGGQYRGVPFLSIAPPSSVHLAHVVNWMLPTERAMTQLVRNGELRAREALRVAAEAKQRLHAAGSPEPDFAHTPVAR